MATTLMDATSEIEDEHVCFTLLRSCAGACRFNYLICVPPPDLYHAAKQILTVIWKERYVNSSAAFYLTQFTKSSPSPFQLKSQPLLQASPNTRLHKRSIYFVQCTHKHGYHNDYPSRHSHNVKRSSTRVHLRKLALPNRRRRYQDPRRYFRPKP